MKNDIRVVVVDDHHLTRGGIINLIIQNPKVKVVGEGCAGNHIFELLEQHHPDMLITDLQMPAQENGAVHALFEPVTSLQKVKRQFPDMTIMIITQEDDIQTIQSLAEIGVNGYFLKSDDSTHILPMAIEMVHHGGTYFSPEVKEVIHAAPKLKPATALTERHIQVLNAIVRSPASTRAEQAHSLHISENTLQKHITQIFSILNVPNMESCILKALRMRLVHNPTISPTN
jgi:two-component system invasion response regulator UvrY